jgi:hypothetical protein
MGCGNGLVSVKISLADYQKQPGSGLKVDSGTNTYTFIKGTHVIDAMYEIVFGSSDQLVIPDNTTITLEGNFLIKEKTNYTINRITVNGTFNHSECATIEIGAINGGRGIFVDNGGIFNQHGGTIDIGELTGVVGNGDGNDLKITDTDGDNYDFVLTMMVLVLLFLSMMEEYSINMVGRLMWMV